MKLFVEFPFKLYKEHPNWVPPLMGDEYDTFNPKKNGAYLHSSSECYLAYKDGELVGRVAAIVNRKANELWNDRNVRFGWFDFVEEASGEEAFFRVSENAFFRLCSFCFLLT